MIFDKSSDKNLNNEHEQNTKDTLNDMKNNTESKNISMRNAEHKNDENRKSMRFLAIDNEQNELTTNKKYRTGNENEKISVAKKHNVEVRCDTDNIHTNKKYRIDDENISINSNRSIEDCDFSAKNCIQAKVKNTDKATLPRINYHKKIDSSLFCYETHKNDKKHVKNLDEQNKRKIEKNNTDCKYKVQFKVYTNLQNEIISVKKKSDNKKTQDDESKKHIINVYNKQKLTEPCDDIYLTDYFYDKSVNYKVKKNKTRFDDFMQNNKRKNLLKGRNAAFESNEPDYYRFFAKKFKTQANKEMNKDVQKGIKSMQKTLFYKKNMQDNTYDCVDEISFDRAMYNDTNNVRNNNIKKMCTDHLYNAHDNYIETRMFLDDANGMQTTKENRCDSKCNNNSIRSSDKYNENDTEKDSNGVTVECTSDDEMQNTIKDDSENETNLFDSDDFVIDKNKNYYSNEHEIDDSDTFTKIHVQTYNGDENDNTNSSTINDINTVDSTKNVTASTELNTQKKNKGRYNEISCDEFSKINKQKDITKHNKSYIKTVEGLYKGRYNEISCDEFSKINKQKDITKHTESYIETVESIFNENYYKLMNEQNNNLNINCHNIENNNSFTNISNTYEYIANSECYSNVITDNYTINGEVLLYHPYGPTKSTCNSLFTNPKYNKVHRCLYPRCPNLYSSITAMRFHLKMKHGIIYKEDKPIKCRIRNCEKSFKSRGGLIYHKKHCH